MTLWSLFQMKRMVKNIKIALLLYTLCFVIIYSYVKENSRKNVKVSTFSFSKKFRYFNDSIQDRNRQCFHLEWKYRLTAISELITPNCQRFITIGGSKGRTGNDLFQIATILGLAYRYDLIPIIPSSFPLHKFVNLPNIVDLQKEPLSNSVHFSSEKTAIYKNFSKRLSSEFHNFTMHGTFQSWRYFNTERDMVNNALRLKSVHFENAEKFMIKMNPAGYKQICIHIRRGDFTEPEQIKRGYVVVDEKFVEKAKDILKQNSSKVVTFVVTNDKRWCREHLKNVIISPFDNPGDDLALMALSDHVVVSAGTFGWWGAWLAGGKVVYYREFPRSDSYISRHFNKYDYYPPHWKGIV